MTKKIKKEVLFAVLIAVGGIAFPFAFVDGLAATIAAYTASAITGIFLLTTATVSLVFSTFADWFLRVTLSPEFINVPYTPGADGEGNEFVFYGWSIVRDFVNMFFILILIIIGLSTSLQFETYRWQKTLPRLVAVALLVNFTPVILGIFIDAANIMMNYFVSSLASESIFVIRMRGLFDVMASNLADTPWTSFTGAIITPVAMMIIFTLFNTLTGFIYGLYGLIFAMRYVAIWLLVIISPFGFFCYILPATQPFFKKWWTWFVGWCLVGVAGAFFLYLGEIMFQFIDQSAMMPASTEHHGMDIGVFIQVFPLMIPLLFILFGLFITISFSSLGSKGIVGAIQKVSGEKGKVSSLFSKSVFKEKTEAASSAVKSAFSPGPSVSSSTTSSPENQPSFKKSMRADSLHRRKAETEPSVGGTSTPLTEVSSFAEDGTASATKEVAAEFGKSAGEGAEKLSPMTESSGASGSTTKKSSEKKTPEKKCSSCGSSISGNTALCPFCKKNTFASKE